jgi:hypothetical protein
MKYSEAMRQNAAHSHEGGGRIPVKGDRIELLRPRTGVRVRGTVFHVDQVQILVKWDDGRSESLRPGVDPYRIVDAA